MRFFILIFFLVFSYLVFSQENEAFLVGDIRVEGNVTTSEDAIITLSSLKIGDRLLIPSPKVQRAIKKLLAEGVFYDIEVLRLQNEGINLLKIKLKEYLILADIHYKGLSGIELNKLNKNPKLNQLKRYSPNSLSVIKQEVSALLFQKGYRNCEITLVGNTNEFGFIELEVVVSKGERFKIGKVNLSGNITYSTSKVLKQLNKNERLPSFKPGKVFNHSFKSIKKRIQQAYKDYGYLDAEITKS